MVKKVPIRIRIKKVIHALREGKKTWSNLKELGIPEKTLHRILKDYLEFCGLAKKEGNYWVWYEHSRIFKSKYDYDLAIGHSRKLIPAFKSMLNITKIDRVELFFAAKEHLKSYPEIYAKLEKFEELFNARVRYLFQKYGHKIVTSDKFWIFDTVRIKKKGLLGKLGVSELKFRKRNVPYKIDLGKSKPSEDEMKELNELRDLLDNTKTFNESFEVYRDFAGDISLLVLKIEMGEPLEGKCSLCPKIKIIEKKEGVE